MLGLLLLSAPLFVGSKTCAACHPRIVANQAKTAHARALAPAADRRVKADWAFGAGAQAITYVSRLDEDHYLEHPLSYYTAAKALAPTPGHETRPQGVRYPTFAPDAAILRCFQCHSTGTLSVARRTIRPFETGVRCEACHGPGGEHAAKPSPANIRNPKRLTAAELNGFCGTCHRMPPAAGSGTNWSNPWNTRHQPVYLSQSPCFQRSNGKLSCLTCHRPHEDARRDVQAQCKSCHPAVRHTTGIAGRACTGCHMPAVKPEPYLRFTNHWIGIYRQPLTPGNRLRPLPQRPRSRRVAALLEQ